MCDMEPNTPNAPNNQNIAMMTTPALKIFLIFPSMGMYVLMSQSTTPAMKRMIRREISDINDSLLIKCLIFYPALILNIEVNRNNHAGILLLKSHGAIGRIRSPCPLLILVYKNSPLNNKKLKRML
jgi:hypothetical protein